MRRTRRNHGSLLVVTAWLLTILALLALGVSARGGLHTRLTSYDTGWLQAQLAARAGVQRLRELLARDEHPNVDALNEAWASGAEIWQAQPVLPDATYVDVHYVVTDARALDESRIVYGAQDEQSRLHLNAAYVTVEMLAALPGLDLDVAQAIIAFRAAPDTYPAEEAYYGTLQPPYTTKAAPYESMAELTLVRGMTPERFDVVSAYCTVYPTEGAPVNLNTAPRVVLQAMGLSSVLVEDILRFRAGDDGLPGTADDGIFDQVEFLPDDWSISIEDADVITTLKATQALDVRSQAAHIWSEGYLASGDIQVRLEAVILRSSDASQSAVAAWRWH